MTIWLDNHLSPALAAWVAIELETRCVHIRDLGLARATDADIFARARREAVAIITKDRDFSELAVRLGPPPAIILLTIGNTSTSHIRTVLGPGLRNAWEMTRKGESLVELA